MIMAANPYARNNYPGKFEIVYEGPASSQAKDFHCFRIRMAGHDGMDAHMFKAEVTEWLLNAAYGENHFGNGFGASKQHPVVGYPNPNGKDCFVLLDNMVDVVRFEDRFTVTGYSPSLVA